MTFFESFFKWNGKFVDLDKAYGPQCMDWMHQFVIDVYGLDRSNLAAPSAKRLWYNFPNVKGSQHFTKIANRPWNVPKQGDIIIWGFGTYGHVAIVNTANVWNLTSIDQNYPLNSPVHIQSHNYINCLGWLRMK